MCRETLEMRPALATALRPSAAAASEGRAQRRRTCRLLPLAALWVRSQAARQNPVSDKISAKMQVVLIKEVPAILILNRLMTFIDNGAFLKTLHETLAIKVLFSLERFLSPAVKMRGLKVFFFKILHKEHILIFFYTQRKEK